MRGRTKAMLASGAIAWALVMPGQYALAVTLPAPAALNGAHAAPDPITQVRTVCEKQWDGYQWIDQCRTVGTRRHYSMRSRLRSLERRAMRYLRYW